MAQPIETYRDLRVWQKGLQLIDEIDGLVSKLNSFQRWSIGMQMYRAALSIVLNIAEGHDHDYTRVYLHRLADARGSVREVQASILVIRHGNYLPDSSTEASLELLDGIGRMLRSLRTRVRASMGDDASEAS
jgi:four helix bundle protein